MEMDGDFLRIALKKQKADYSEACTKSENKGFSKMVKLWILKKETLLDKKKVTIKE